MKAYLLLVMIISLLHTNAQNYKLLPFKVKNKYGLKNTEGAIIFNAQFDMAYQSKGGLSSVEKNDKKGIVNYKGEVVYKCKYTYLEAFRNERMARKNQLIVGSGTKYGLINNDEKLLIKVKYDTVYRSYSSIIIEKNNQYGAYYFSNAIADPELKLNIEFDTIFGTFYYDTDFIYEAIKNDTSYYYDITFKVISHLKMEKLKAKFKILEENKKKRFDSFAFEPSYYPSEPKSRSTLVYDFAENPPKFPGGNDNVKKYIESNLKYPEDAINEGLQGMVYVQFVVIEDGSLTEIEVLKGVCPSIDNEAIRLVNEMPKWSPATQNDKKIKCRYTIPIRFKL
ncbi:MAG: energy transducer TonB [Crocinitomicaceae bacterium]